MTETMERILVLLLRAKRSHTPTREDAWTCADIAYRLGFQTGSDRSAHDGRFMSPAQRVIGPVIALRKRGLLEHGHRPGGRSGTAYRLTPLGERVASERIQSDRAARGHYVEVVRSNTMVYHAVCTCGWTGTSENIEAFAYNDKERHEREVG
jgi:hypothetical protein